MKKLLASLFLVGIVLTLPACGWRKKEKCQICKEQSCIIQEEDFGTDEIVGEEEEEIIEYNQKELFN